MIITFIWLFILFLFSFAVMSNKEDEHSHGAKHFMEKHEENDK